MTNRENRVWRKSRHSAEQALGTCVEIAKLSEGMGIRDSKNPGDPHLVFSGPAWAALLGVIKSEAI